jgi:hypothetical protein
MNLVADIGDVAAGRFDAAEMTVEERLHLIEVLCDQDRERRDKRREQRAAHTRGFIISVVLICQGLTDISMWAKV